MKYIISGYIGLAGRFLIFISFVVNIIECVCACERERNNYINGWMRECKETLYYKMTLTASLAVHLAGLCWEWMFSLLFPLSSTSLLFAVFVTLTIVIYPKLECKLFEAGVVFLSPYKNSDENYLLSRHSEFKYKLHN